MPRVANQLRAPLAFSPLSALATPASHGPRKTDGAVDRWPIFLHKQPRNTGSVSSKLVGIKFHGGSRVRVALWMSFIVMQPSTKIPPGVVAYLGPVGGILSVMTWKSVTPVENISPFGNHFPALPC